MFGIRVNNFRCYLKDGVFYVGSLIKGVIGIGYRLSIVSLIFMDLFMILFVCLEILKFEILYMFCVFIKMLLFLRF